MELVISSLSAEISNSQTSIAKHPAIIESVAITKTVIFLLGLYIYDSRFGIKSIDFSFYLDITIVKSIVANKVKLKSALNTIYL